MEENKYITRESLKDSFDEYINTKNEEVWSEEKIMLTIYNARETVGLTRAYFYTFIDSVLNSVQYILSIILAIALGGLVAAIYFKPEMTKDVWVIVCLIFAIKFTIMLIKDKSYEKYDVVDQKMMYAVITTVISHTENYNQLNQEEQQAIFDHFVDLFTEKN